MGAASPPLWAADVVGYSRLIRTDEDGTLATLKALQADLIGPKIAEHRGRVVKLMGDGITWAGRIAGAEIDIVNAG